MRAGGGGGLLPAVFRPGSQAYLPPHSATGVGAAVGLQPSGSSDAALCQPVCGNRKRPEGHPLKSAPHQNPPASDPPPGPPGRFFGVLSRANCGPLGRSCPWGLPRLYVVMEALSVSRSFLPIGCWGSAALSLNCWSITRFYSQCALY